MHVHSEKFRRILSGLTLSGLILTQFSTGVFPIPIAPISDDKVIAAVDPCPDISNTATITSSNHSTITTNTVTTVTNCPQPGITVSKTVDKTTLTGASGVQRINYGIVVNNVGQVTLTSIAVGDTIPAGTTYIDSASDSRCNQSGNAVVCTLSSLNVSQSTTFNLKFDINTDTVCNQTIYNTATVGTSQTSSVTTNSVSTTVSACPQPSMTATKVSDKTVIQQGQIVTFTINVRNTGGVDIINAIIHDPVPVGLVYNDAQSDSLCDLLGSTVQCGPFPLAKSANRDFKLAFTLNNNPPCGQTITNQGDVTASNAPTIWTTVASVQVQCLQPGITVSKTVDKTTLTGASGVQRINYGITANNVGQVTLTNIAVGDTIPAGTTYIDSASDSRCDQSGNAVVCTASSLNVSQSTTFNLKFDVDTNTVCNQTIFNTATVGTSQTSSVTTNSVSTTVSACPNPPILTIEKTGPATVTRGQQITYTLVAQNTGGSAAQNVAFVDYYPPALTFVSASNAGCTTKIASQGDPYIHCPIGTLNINQTATVTLTFTVQPSVACSSKFKNQGSAQGGGLLSGWSEVKSTVICPQAVTKVSKTGPATANAGDILTYSVAVMNWSDNIANLVEMRDTIPADLTFVSAGSSTECAQQGGDIVCTLATLAARDQKVFTLKFQTQASQSCQTVTNTAKAKAENAPETSMSATTLLNCPQPGITVAKTVDKTTLTGASGVQRINYGITANNVGQVTLTNIAVGDTIPVGTTYIDSASDSRCNQSGNAVVCTLSSLNVAQSTTFNLKFDINTDTVCNQTIYNTATVGTSQTSSVTTNSVSTTVSACPQPNINVTKTVNRSSAVPGDTLLYTIRVENTGNGAATGRRVTDQIPTGLTYNASASDTRCQVSSGIITCGPFDLLAGRDTSFVLVFTVNSSAPCNGTINNYASVILNNNALEDTSDWATTSITCPGPDLRITKTGQSQVTTGDQIVYTFTVNNQGLGVAPNVYVDDHFFNSFGVPLTVPLPFQYQSAAGATCTASSTKVACSLGDIQAGASKTFTITFLVPISNLYCGKVVKNTAYVDSGPVNGNGDASASHSVNVNCPKAVIKAKKVADKTVVSPNDFVTFTINVENTSTTDATGVSVSDTIPNHLQYIDASADTLCNQVGNNVVCGTFDLAAGAKRDINLVFKVLSTAPCTGTISNTGEVTASNADPTWTNNATVDVFCPNPSFTTQKLVDKIQVRPGESLSYDIIVRNTGNVVLQGVQITDAVPFFLTFNAAGSDTRCSLQGSSVRCTGGAIGIGQPDTFRLKFDVTATAQCNAELNNTAYVLITGQSGLDAYTNTVKTTVYCPQTTLTIEKQQNKSIAYKGEIVTYTLRVRNTGSEKASAVTVSDTVPFNLRYEDAQSDALCDLQSGTVTCSGFDLTAGQTRDFQLAFTVLDSAPCNGNIFNTAQTRAFNAPQVSSNQTSLKVECLAPHLTIVKDGPVSVDAGGNVTYSFTAINDGNGIARAVNVTDVFTTATGTPLGSLPFTFVGSSGASCSLGGNTISCALGNMQPNVPQSFTMTFSVPRTGLCKQTVYNDATVRDGDGISVDNDTHAVLVDCGNPDISAEKTVSRTVASPSDSLTYVISVNNTGAGDATGLTVSDTIATGLTFNAIGSDSRCSIAGNVLTCGPFNLNAGKSTTFTLAFTVNDSAPCNGRILNSAQVLLGGVTVDNTGVVYTDIVCPKPNLKLFKNVSATQVHPDGSVSYFLTAQNTGNGPAHNVTVTDPVPPYLTYNDALSDPLCNLINGIVSCGVFELAPGASRLIEMRFTVNTNAVCNATIHNTAEVTASNADTNWSNEIAVQIICPQTTLTIEKQQNKSIAYKGEIVTYTLRVRNTGSEKASAVTVSDTVPFNLRYEDAQSDALCDLQSGTVTCSGFDLTAGQTRDFQLAFTVLDSAPCNGNIFNTAQTRAFNAPQVSSNQTSLKVECLAPHLTIVKDGPVSVDAGGNVTYSFTAINDGNGIARAVNVTDVFTTATGTPLGSLPFTFVGSSGASCSLGGNTISCALGNMQPNVPQSFTMTFSVPRTGLCKQTVYNDATVRDGDGISVDNDTHAVLVDCGNPDISAEKTVSRTVASPSDSLTYVISVNNTGAGDATGLTVSDTIATGLTFNAIGSDSRCSIAGNVLTCGPFNLNAGKSTTFTLAFTVNDSAPCNGRILNSAQVLLGGVTVDNTGVVYTDIVCPKPNLKLFKNVSATQVHPDGSVSYFLTAQNTGNGPAHNVTVTDPVPPYLTYNDALSDPLCNLINGIVSCGVFELAPGASRLIEMRFTVNTNAVCNATIHNTAEVTASNADTNWSNEIAVRVDCLSTSMQATKTVDRVTLSGGSGLQQIIYGITVRNTGQTPLASVVINDTIPNGMQYIDTASDARCDQSGQSIICTTPSIPVGGQNTFTLAFNVDTNTQCGKTILNVAGAAAVGVTAGTNTVQTVISACQTPSFTATKTANKTTVTPGQQLSYDIAIRNTGQVSLSGTMVTDTVPTGLTFNATQSDSRCFLQGNQVKCGDTAIAAGQTDTYTLVFDVNTFAPCGGKISNQAYVVFLGSNNLDGNTNIVQTPVECPEPKADLKVKKTGPAQISRGTTITYQVMVTNVGPDAAQNITITDTVPSVLIQNTANTTPLTFNASDSDPLCHLNNTIVTCSGFDLASGTSRSFAIAFNVPANAFCAKPILNEVEVWSTTEDPITGNNDDEFISTVDCPTLTIEKTDNRTTVKAGETLTYTITVTNTSASDATNVEIIDTLPADVTFVSASDGGVLSNGKVTWTIDIDAGDSETLTVQATVKNSVEDGDVIHNEVCIQNGDCDDDETVVIIDTVTGCIDVKKETFNPNGTVLTPVTQFTFRLDGGSQTVVNDSSGNARFNNVTVGTHTVSETIPSGWTQINVTPVSGQVSVPAGSGCTTVTFKNQQNGGGTPQFTIEKTDNETEVSPGDSLNYLITVRNISTTNATNVTVTDSVPSRTTFVSASDSASRNGNTVTWTFDLAAGASKTLTMRVNTDSNITGRYTVRNTACVTSGPCDDDTTDVVEEEEEENGDISISVDDDPDPIDVCTDDVLEYEIRLTNSGNSNEDVDVIALLDSATDFQSASDSGRERSNDRVEWNNINVNRNSSRTIRLTVRVNTTIRDGDTVRLQVAESGGESDTEITRVRNNCDDYIPPPPPQGTPDLTIDKSADVTEALAGSIVSYTITIRNTGGTDIASAMLTDDYPETLIAISDPGGATDAGGNLSWNLGTLRANSTTIVRYRARLNAGVTHGTQVRNTATVRAGSIVRSDDHLIVVPTPPQTGLGGFLKSFGKSQDSLTASVNGGQNSEDASGETAGNLALIVWLTTMFTGLGLGGLLGRRFFF